MCRSIKVLRQSDNPPTSEEITAAALQFVRKISGCRVPSRINEQAFMQAVREIAESSKQLLNSMNQPRKSANSSRTAAP